MTVQRGHKKLRMKNTSPMKMAKKVDDPNKWSLDISEELNFQIS